jgi:hypothetical protein
MIDVVVVMMIHFFQEVFDLLQMQDKESAHEQDVSSLTQRIEKLEHELQQYREVNSDAELKYKVS